MKFVHLSDLHLGKRVNEFSMIEDQAYILTKILGIIREERPDGVLIAGETADSLSAVMEGAREIAGSVNKISSASQNQKMVLQEVVKSVGLIEGVVQSNISAAQDSAETSEELSKQSKRFYELVNQFRLKGI